tara:strand:- start:45 stop:374 length:330 start_codon:yes stop_codon:yes gene_type:complete
MKKLIKIQGNQASLTGGEVSVIDFGTEGVLFWGIVDDTEPYTQLSTAGIYNASHPVTAIYTGGSAGDSTQKDIIDAIEAAVGANPGSPFLKAGPLVGQLAFEQTSVNIT